MKKEIFDFWFLVSTEKNTGFTDVTPAASSSGGLSRAVMLHQILHQATEKSDPGLSNYFLKDP